MNNSKKISKKSLKKTPLEPIQKITEIFGRDYDWYFNKGCSTGGGDTGPSAPAKTVPQSYH